MEHGQRGFPAQGRAASVGGSDEGDPADSTGFLPKAGQARQTPNLEDGGFDQIMRGGSGSAHFAGFLLKLGNAQMKVQRLRSC